MKQLRAARVTVLIGILVLFAAAGSLLVINTGTAHAATYTVTNTNNSGAGSLRQAIDDANSNPGADTIDFDIPGAGPHIIQPASFLPAFTDPVTVDGYTQPGSARATAATPATILIELDGSSAGASVGGLYFWNNTAGSRVTGLAINNWDRDGIYILGDGAVTVEGNHIGTDATGTIARPNQDCGVIIQQECSSGTVVGGTTPGERNVISGNNGDGVSSVLADDCVIQGNYIGVDSGGSALGNTGNGVSVYGDDNIVGGTTAAGGNIISANIKNGVLIGGSTGCKVTGNYIGTDRHGVTEMPNGGHGVDAEGDKVTVGGDTAGLGNIISGNKQQGVNVDDSSGTIIRGNLIGTNASGTAALPNRWSGVCLCEGSDNVTVGGPTAAKKNVISGNDVYGIDIQDTKKAVIQGNYFGTNAAGSGGLGNGYSGVKIWKSSRDVTVGGDTAGEGNLISANGYAGLDISDCGGVTAEGNHIGTNAAGNGALENGYYGVSVAGGSDDTVIGGTSDGGANVISGNDIGVYLTQCSGVTVQGNLIGTTAGNTGALGNKAQGVYIYQGTGGNTIGGTASGAGNVIAYNGKEGVGVKESTGCEIIRNRILNNKDTGVVIWDKASYRNKISMNSIYGNVSLGINFSGTGIPTPNDGNNNNHNKPNRGYNYPVITGSSFLSPGGAAVISGTAPPNSVVEIFAAGKNPDPSGHGQGFTYLAATNADASGDFTLKVNGLADNQVVSSTATSPEGDPSGEGNTSEFSSNANVTTPRIAGCDPVVVVQGHTVNVDITGGGTHFKDGVSRAVLSGSGITVNSTHVSDDNHAMANITVAPDAEPGTRSLNVVTGSETPAPLDNVFQVKQAPPSPPSLSSVDPGSGSVGTHVTLSGQHFGDTMGASYVMFNGTKVNSYDSWSGGKVVCGVPGGATSGPVTITTPGGVSNGIVFTVTGPQSPSIKDCSPTGVVQGHTVEINILGENTGFQNGVSRAEISGGGITVDYTYISGATSASAGVAVAADAQPGVREVNVVTGGETPAPLKNVFTIYSAPAAAPVIRNIQPARGCAGSTVSVTGTNFGEAAGSSRVSFGGIPAMNYVSWSDHEVILSVPAGASSGPVKVITPWGESNGFAFTVTNPTFYFAEGTCRPEFQPYLTIGNPGTAAADVEITYMKGDGTIQQQALKVPPTARATVDVKGVLGEGNGSPYDFSARVECANKQQIIVAERPMYFNYRDSWNGGTDVIGALSPADAFYFAEGTCRPGFEPYLTIQNPDAGEADVKITYMKGDGSTEQQEVKVPGTSRTTVTVKDVIGEGDSPAYDFSAKVETTNSQDIVAERPMYFNYRGAWTGGSDVVGALSPAETFYFAEGTCRPGFEPYITIQNPSGAAADLLITYYTGDGATREQALTVPPTTRKTVTVKDVLGEGDDAAHDFSCKVESTNNVDVVAERPMYFNYHGVWTGGSDVIGAVSPASTFYFAEGTCRPGFEPYLTIENPEMADAQVKITYMLGDGNTREQNVTVPAHSRYTVTVTDILGVGNDAAHDFSAKVECFNNKKLIVERPMYFDFNGWTGGSDVIGFSP